MERVTQVSELYKAIANLTRAEMYVYCKTFGLKGFVRGAAR